MAAPDVKRSPAIASTEVRADIRRMTAPLQLRLYVPDRFDKNEMPLRPRHGRWELSRIGFLMANNMRKAPCRSFR